MTDFTLKGDDLRMVVQAIIQARTNLRSAENLLDTVSPYCDGRTAQDINRMVVQIQTMSVDLNNLYKRNAKEAFGGELPGAQPAPVDKRQS